MPRPLIVEAVMTEDLAYPARPPGRRLPRRPRRAAARRASPVRMSTAPSPAGRRPVIVTCRPAWEGGRFAGAEADRLEHPASRPWNWARNSWTSSGTRPARAASSATAIRQRIVALHARFRRHAGEPATDGRARCVASSPGVVKLAVTPSRLERPRDARSHRPQPPRRPCSSGWAPSGSRRAPCPRTSVRAGPTPAMAVAPGQVRANRLVDEFRVRDDGLRDAGVRRRRTAHRPFGVAGHAQRGVRVARHRRGCTCPCEAVSFDDFLTLAEALPIVGVSVTAPFKEDAAAVADRRRAEPPRRSTRCGDGPTAGGKGSTPTSTVSWRRSASIDLRGARRLRARRGWRGAVGVAGLRRKGARIRVMRGRPTPVRASPRSSSSSVGLAGAVRRPGMCSSTRPRSARIPMWTLRPWLAVRSTDDSSTTWSTTRGRRGCCAMRRSAGCRTIDGLDMLVQQAVAAVRVVDRCDAVLLVMRAAAERRLAEMTNDE